MDDLDENRQWELLKTPESQALASSPLQATSTPITPPSEDRREVEKLGFGLGSSIEAPNDRRRRESRAAQREHRVIREKDHEITDMDEIVTREMYLRAATQWYKERAERDEEIQRLVNENNRLTQHNDYVTSLETEYGKVSTDNEQLLDRIGQLRRSNADHQLRAQNLESELNTMQQKVIAYETQKSRMDNYPRKQELQQRLEHAEQENNELYNKCVSLQTELDECKAEARYGSTAVKETKRVDLDRETEFDADDLVDLKEELARLHDELNEKIEVPMREKGIVLFFQSEEVKRELESKQRQVIEMTATIKSLQDEIEASRRGEDPEEKQVDMAKDELNRGTTSTSSLDGEYKGKCEALSKELKLRQSRIQQQESIIRALKSFRDNMEQQTSGDAYNDLRAKTGQMDNLAAHLNNRVEDLQAQLEYLKTGLLRVHIDDLVDTEALIDQAQEMIQDCGKVIMLADDIQYTIQRISDESVTDLQSVCRTPSREQFEDEMTLLTPLHEDVDTDKNDGVSSSIIDHRSRINRIGQALDELFEHFTEGFSTEDTEDEHFLCSFGGLYKASQRQTTGNLIKLNVVSDSAPPLSVRIWTEIICAGSVYWTEVLIENRPHWLMVRGPFWWSLVVQMLMLSLIPSVTLAWWCIMTASAERELWLQANEMTMKKYWDTTVWGAERDLIWRIFYGLGYI